MVLEQARAVIRRPDQRKRPPQYTTSLLAEILGIERTQVDYRVRNPQGLPTGTLNRSSRRMFTLEELQAWSRHYRRDQMRHEGASAVTIVLAHFKGGSGKTTTAATLAQGLSRKGHKGLVVDCDPQGSVTTLFDYLPDAEIEEDQTLIPLLRGAETNVDGIVLKPAPSDVKYAIRSTYWTGIDLVPAASTLFAAEIYLPVRQMNEDRFEYWRVLDYALDPVRSDYDFIIIDTPPSLSYLTTNALYAADCILMPLPPYNLDFASSTQFWSLFSDLSAKFEEHGKGKRWSSVDLVLSKVKTTGQSSAILREWITAAYGGMLVPTEIPEMEAVRAASKDFGTVFDGANESNRSLKRALESYERLVEHIEGRMAAVWRQQLGG